MADNKYFNDDAIKAKLSSLNETQEVIVNVAQWLLFNKRNAGRTAELWLQRVKDSQPTKRLSLIYLANEVVQQSKARKKDEFVNAFAPQMAEALGIAYRSVPVDIQQKLKRVVEVWRARFIFDAKTQGDVEQRLGEIDRERVSKRTLGGALFSAGDASVPAPLQPLVNGWEKLAQVEAASTAALSAYTSQSTPSSLSAAESALRFTLSARQSLVSTLQALLDEQTSTLHRDDDALAGLEAQTARQSSTPGDAPAAGIARPSFEALTPPPVESLTPPVQSPKRSASAMETGGVPAAANLTGVPNLSELLGLPKLGGLTAALSQPGPHAPATETNGDAEDSEHSAKRRKVAEENKVDFARLPLDPDVEAMLAN